MKFFYTIHFIALCLLFCMPTPSYCAALSPAEILQQADARIEKIRKADAKLVLLDMDGQPLRAGTEIQINQVNHAFLFGSNIFRFDKYEDPKLNALYKDRFKDLLNFATLGFYWKWYEKQQGQTLEEYWDGVARWCRKNDIETKGHPLFWTTEPGWVNKLAEDESDALIFGRIEREVKAFAGLVDRWDVLNEPGCGISQGKERNALTAVRQYEILGTSGVIAKAFETARKANPETVLILNDYDTSDKYEKTIEECLKASAEIDVIGIQSHMHRGYWGAKKTWDVCERFGRFDKPLHFTEVTIVSGPGKWNDWRKSTPEGEKQQAQEVAEFYTVLFSHPAVEAITWWDLSDKGSWQRAPAGLIDEDMNPKPAYLALQKLIKGKWWTETTAKVGKDGSVDFRGFLGKYELSIKQRDTILRLPFVLEKSDKPVKLQISKFKDGL